MTKAPRKHLSAHNASGYRGVSRFRDRWRAQIKVNGSRCSLGVYADPRDAAHAYDDAARQAWGPNTPALNFRRQAA